MNVVENKQLLLHTVCEYVNQDIYKNDWSFELDTSNLNNTHLWPRALHSLGNGQNIIGQS